MMLTNTAILDPLTKSTRSPKLDKKERFFDDACGIAQNLRTPSEKNPGSAPEFKGYEGLYGIITNLILKDQCKYLNMLNELTIILLLKLNWL